MSFSDYLENKVLDHVFRNTAYSAATTIYIALFTSAQNDAGSSGTEISTSGTGYARASVSPATGFSSASGGSLLNSGTISFTTASASWGTITHFGIYDALTAGNLLAHGQLTTSKTVGSGDTVSFAAGALQITLD